MKWRFNMTTAHIKKAIKIGGSLAIILPRKWVTGRIEPGQEMIVVANGELRIFPVHEKDELAHNEAENKSMR